MQLAQLLHGDRRGRAHKQILGALIHREKHDFPQILLPREQHDDAVDAGRDPAMRRRPILKRAIHAAEFLQKDILVIAREREGLFHNVWAMVPDRTGRKLHAIADDVILKRLDAEDCFLVGGIKPNKRFRIEIRHRKRVVRKVDLLFVLVPLIHREIDDPTEFENVFFGEAEFIADLEPRRPGELGGFVFLIASEEHRVAEGAIAAGRRPTFSRDFHLQLPQGKNIRRSVPCP